VENKVSKTNYVISSNSKHDLPFNTEDFLCENVHMEERRKMSRGIEKTAKHDNRFSK
jgi:exosome complex RNA-binding protein Csl4